MYDVGQEPILHGEKGEPLKADTFRRLQLMQYAFHYLDTSRFRFEFGKVFYSELGDHFTAEALRVVEQYGEFWRFYLYFDEISESVCVTDAFEDATDNEKDNKYNGTFEYDLPF